MILEPGRKRSLRKSRRWSAQTPNPRFDSLRLVVLRRQSPSLNNKICHPAIDSSWVPGDLTANKEVRDDLH